MFVHANDLLCATYIKIMTLMPQNKSIYTFLKYVILSTGVKRRKKLCYSKL